MSPVRARKEAAKRLALELEKRYRALVEAGNSEDAVAKAAVDLGQLFNDNIEFTINVLRDYGGLQARFEPMHRPAVNDVEVVGGRVPETPAIFRAGCDVDLPRKR